MDNLEKIKRHLGRPVSLSFKNTIGDIDTFDFKPLNIAQQAVFMEISKRIRARPKMMIDGIEVPDTAKEDMTDMFDLFVEIVKNSINGIDESMAKEFVDNNYEQLIENIENLLPQNSNKSALDKIKARQEEIRLARQSN